MRRQPTHPTSTPLQGLQHATRLERLQLELPGATAMAATPPVDPLASLPALRHLALGVPAECWQELGPALRAALPRLETLVSAQHDLPAWRNFMDPALAVSLAE